MVWRDTVKLENGFEAHERGWNQRTILSPITSFL
jgi:hypothetical protein